MNGLKLIREKSNISRNALAERMGVTRQTIILWEKGTRRPNAKHLEWLSTFYGISEKWFGELTEAEVAELSEKRLYAHWDGDKEYYTFSPENENDAKEPSFLFGSMESMAEEKYADSIKAKKELLKRVDDYLTLNGDTYSFDKAFYSKARMHEVEEYLLLMDSVQKIGTEGRHLKVPFRYEIRTMIYAMMVASGCYTIEDIKEIYGEYFEEGGTHVEMEYLSELIELMKEHWKTSKANANEKRFGRR